MKKEEIKKRFDRYLRGELTSEEARELFLHLGNEENLHQIRQAVRDRFMRLEETPPRDDPALDELYDRVYQRILDETTSDEAENGGIRGKTFFLRSRAAAAAAILILASVLSYWFFASPRAKKQLRSQHVTAPANDILPGGNKAILTLANGDQVILDEAGIGTLTEQKGVRVVKTKEGQILYDSSPLPEKSNTPPSYNIVTTPRGGQYQVVLPDGSKVWLNAASSLRYPTAFQGNERKVVLQGEGYFEVAPDETKPFLVRSGSQVIHVLGTSFNLMAYEDEGEVRTTLLEGSLKISWKGENRVLKPGEQARIVDDDPGIAVRAVNTDASVAWKKGQFVFEGEKLQRIMRKISRWYDVEVVYQGEITDNDFIGTVSRFENVSEILKLLELTGTVRFQIEGSGSNERRIIVMR